MCSLEENRAFVLSALERRLAPVENLRLFSVIASFQHNIVSASAYEALRSRISDVTPSEWKVALETIAILGYRSGVPGAEALSDGDHAGIVVFDGLIALLTLLNVGLMESHSAYTNRLLMKLDSTLTGAADPQHMPNALRSNKWIESLVSLLMYWATDLTSEELLPMRDENDIHSTAQMLTEFQQVFVVCHELGHFLYDWAMTYPATRSMIESRLEEAASTLQADFLSALTVKDPRQHLARLHDERAADHNGFRLYRRLVDSVQLNHVQKGVAQAAPYVFFYYIEVVEALRALRFYFQFDGLESKLFEPLRAAMSACTHVGGQQRRQEYVAAAGDWMNTMALQIISSYSAVMDAVSAATTAPGPGIDAWGTFLGRSGERG